MTQQRILVGFFLTCVTGAGFSFELISSQSSPPEETREAIIKELQILVSFAQEYYRQPHNTDGGGDSFIGLTATPEGFAKLTPFNPTAVARYDITRSGNLSSVEITGTGRTPGYDPRRPVKVKIMVWAERSSISILN